MATSPLSLALSQPTSSGGGGSKWARILGAGLTGASFLPQLGGNPQVKNAMLAGGLGMLGTGSGWGALAGVPSLMFGGGGHGRDNSDISVNGGPAYSSMYGPGLPDLEPQGSWDRPESTAPGYQLPTTIGPVLEQTPEGWSRGARKKSGGSRTGSRPVAPSMAPPPTAIGPSASGSTKWQPFPGAGSLDGQIPAKPALPTLPGMPGPPSSSVAPMSGLGQSRMFQDLGNRTAQARWLAALGRPIGGPR